MRDKKILRKEIQSARNRLTYGQRSGKSKIITDKFLRTCDYKKAKNILIYYPFRSEVDTTGIIKKALSNGKRVILPKVEDRILKLYYVTDPSSQLKPGAFDIMEPADLICPGAEPHQVDLAVIPGVCFDRDFNRVGYGGGFYDRLIPLLPVDARKIALCFDLQIINEIPLSKYDRKIDKIITESTIYERTAADKPPGQNSKDPGVAILIPAYNEEKYIEDVIRGCLKYGLDIIIIDDGSRDNTARMVNRFSEDPALKVLLIQHEKNKGKGEALKTGFTHAVNKKYRGVITIDADGQHNVEEIADFLRTVKEEAPDIIVGNRLKNVRGMPVIRTATNFFTSWLISAVAGQSINDVQSGFRFIGYDVLKNVPLETKNFETEPEILLKACWLKYKIINIPITTIYHKNFVSHVNPFIDTYKFFRLLFRSIILKRRFMRSHTRP